MIYWETYPMISGGSCKQGSKINTANITFNHGV